MSGILTPGYLRWDGTKYVTDPSVEIVGPPGPPGAPGGANGPASGDLGGSYPGPSVVGLESHPLPSLTVGFLNWTGSAWAFSSGAGGPPTGLAGGDLAGSYPNPIVAQIRGNTVTPGALTKGQFFVAGSTSNWAATSLSGDLLESAVTAGQVEVTGLLSHVLPALSDGYLNWTGSAWALSTIPSSLPPSGTAGGDLSGTYPNPTVSKIDGYTVVIPGTFATGNVLQVGSPSTSLTYSPVNLQGGANYITGRLPVNTNLMAGAAGQVLISDATPIPAWTTVLGNDGYFSTSFPGVLVVTGLLNQPLPPLTDGYLTWTGSVWALTSGTGGGGGGSPTGPAGGDLSGTYPNPTVVKINGTSGTAAQILLNNNTPTPTWTTVSGDITITNTPTTGTATVMALQTFAVSSSTPVNGGIFGFNGTDWGSRSLTGDVTGLYTGTTVVALQGRTVANIVPADGYVLTWNQGSMWWEPDPITTLQTRNVSAAVPADGQVLTWVAGGNDWEPQPVSEIQGNTVTGGALVEGDLFIATSTSNWAATAVTGDVSFSTGTPGLTTVTALQNNAVSSTPPMDGQSLIWVAGNSDWEPARPFTDNSIIYQQGGTTVAPYIFGTWAEIQSKINETVIPLTVYIDDSVVGQGSASIPGGSGITACKSLVTIATLPSLLSTYLLVENGATLLDPYIFERINILFSTDATNTIVGLDFSYIRGESQCFLRSAIFTSPLAVSTITAACVVADGHNLDIMISSVTGTSLLGQGIFFGGAPMFDVSGGSILDLNCRGKVAIQDGIFTGDIDGYGEIDIFYDADFQEGQGQTFPPFSAFSGTLKWKGLEQPLGVVNGGLGGPVTSDYSAHPGEIIFADPTGGPITITLPPSTGSPGVVYPGTQICIKCVSSSATNNVTVTGFGGAQIDGSPTDVLNSTSFIGRIYVFDGNNWFIFGAYH